MPECEHEQLIFRVGQSVECRDCGGVWDVGLILLTEQEILAAAERWRDRDPKADEALADAVDRIRALKKGKSRLASKEGG